MNFGENDFIQYWAAFQLHMRGADPFDPNLVFAVEKARGWAETKPLMMWNPPWLLALLSPILQLDFQTSAKFFFGLNIFLILFSLYILKSVFDIKKIIFVVFLFPLFLCLKLGQISILILFAASILLYGIIKSKDLLVGIALCLLSVKPQLLYLPLVAILFFINKNRIYRIIFSFAASFGSLFVLLFLQSPNTFFYWSERAKHNTNPKLFSVYSWKTTTLSTLVRDGIFYSTGKFTIWPMFLFAPLCIVTLIYYLFKNRQTIKVQNLWPILIPISCFTTPFGWIYDSAVCMISQVWVFSKPLSKTKLILLVLLQLTLFMQFIVYQPSYYSYWYFYPAYILILLKVYNEQD